MKIAILGYGRMGQMVEAQALARGHQVGAKLGADEVGLDVAQVAERIAGHDAAIDFSMAKGVARHVRACVQAGVPLVEGTTGWRDERETLCNEVEQGAGALVIGENMSIGVNLFYRAVARAAELASSFGYEPFIEEQHHSAKLDAPSGTALALRDVVAGSYDSEISMASTRAGKIPGTHRVGFDGEVDQILLTHIARNREGFAVGALIAAEWLQGRRGVHTIDEVIDDLVSRKS